MKINTLYKLRKQWFVLAAKKFVERYFMGILLLFLFLPGVAIGENFHLFITAITKPFVIISQQESTFLIRIAWLILLMSVFVVWSHSQKRAIKGGDFTIFQESLHPELITDIYCEQFYEMFPFVCSFYSYDDGQNLFTVAFLIVTDLGSFLLYPRVKYVYKIEIKDAYRMIE